MHPFMDSPKPILRGSGSPYRKKDSLQESRLTCLIYNYNSKCILLYELTTDLLFARRRLSQTAEVSVGWANGQRSKATPEHERKRSQRVETTGKQKQKANRN